MSNELEELQSKLKRKDMVIEDLEERLEALKKEVQDGPQPSEEVIEAKVQEKLGDFFGCLQSKDHEIKKLIGERKELHDQLEETQRELKDALEEIQATREAAANNSLAVQACIGIMLHVHDVSEDEAILEQVRSFLEAAGATPVHVEEEPEPNQEPEDADGGPAT